MTGNRTFVFVNRKKAVVGQMLYLEQCNADEVEIVNSGQDASKLCPNRLIFYAVFLLGTAPLSILLLTIVA